MAAEDDVSVILQCRCAGCSLLLSEYCERVAKVTDAAPPAAVSHLIRCRVIGITFNVINKAYIIYLIGYKPILVGGLMMGQRVGRLYSATMTSHHHKYRGKSRL